LKKKNDFISPLADFIVKDVFGTQKNIGNTRGLLKAALDFDPTEYRSMKIVDPHLHRRWKKDKLAIVDVKINTASGIVLHIEVQVNPARDFIPRSLYYNDSLVVDQVGAGNPYKVIKRSISVVIVNFTLLENEPADRYKNVYRFLNTQSHEPFADLQEIVILELPKVPQEDDGTDLWPWLSFFKCKTNEELDMLANKYKAVSEAVREIRRISPVKAIRQMIFEYYDAKWVRESQDAYVREQGYKEAETKYQEQIRQEQTKYQEQIRQEQERIRQLEEENRRLRGE
jgi:predicted transposase/invertase (TIGR01784 family)